MPTLGPLPKRVVGEAGIRWAATAAFLVLLAALMWLLGVSMSPVAGVAVGVVVVGVGAAVLWGRYLEDVRDERTRASSSGVGRIPFQAEVDNDEPAPEQPTQRVQSASYYDDEDD